MVGREEGCGVEVGSKKWWARWLGTVRGANVEQRNRELQQPRQQWKGKHSGPGSMISKMGPQVCMWIVCCRLLRGPRRGRWGTRNRGSGETCRNGVKPTPPPPTFFGCVSQFAWCPLHQNWGLFRLPCSGGAACRRSHFTTLGGGVCHTTPYSTIPSHHPLMHRTPVPPVITLVGCGLSVPGSPSCCCSCRINADMSFYKQEYCGCSYSLRDTNQYRKKEGLPPVSIGLPCLSQRKGPLT